MSEENILVWLPSPMGDAVMCTPALRAIRKKYPNGYITFLAGDIVRAVLSPGQFNDDWLDTGGNVFSLARALRTKKFSKAILFKNSFGSAFTVWLAGIGERTGYKREGRGIFLTDKIVPQKNPDGTFKPEPMIDYYLRIAEVLGCDVSDRRMELGVDENDNITLAKKLPDIEKDGSPIIILVPGGAFGPSKCWSTERFAETADRFTNKYNATVVVSVAPNEAERQIAREICEKAETNLWNLGETALSMGELKALFAKAGLVITNDTGPRHIAIALGRKVISLFGPNNPAWTQTGYADEIQIVGEGQCVPCDKPICRKEDHFCMESISVDMVCSAADRILGGSEQ